MFPLTIIDEDFGSEGTSKMLLFAETSHAPLFVEYTITDITTIDKV